MADNIRYGQNVSESGIGGKTTGQVGEAGQEGGFGGVPDNSKELKDSRSQQGYGQGSGVGG